MSRVPEGAAACPTCGYNGSQQNPQGLLPIGSRIGKGRYLVGRAEEIHTECVDYIAFDVTDYKVRLVREFLPAGGITRQPGEMYMQALEGAEKRYRNGLNRFASSYAKMKDMPEGCAIPRVLDLIQQNGTAYAVIDKFSGMTLRELLRRNGGTLSVAQTEIVMDPVLDALEEVHARGLYHGNISPDCILIDDNGDVRIEEFCVGDRPVTQKAVGFCSPECESGEKAAAASDVYSAAAVFYRCIMGTIPQDGLQRKNFDTLSTMAELDGNVPERVSSAVWNAMLVNRENRTASVSEFRNALKDEEAGSIPSYLSDLYYSEEEAAAEESDERKKRNRWSYLAIISLCLLAVMAAVFLVSLGAGRKEAERRRAQQQEELPESLTVTVPDYRGGKVQDTELDTISFDFLIVSIYSEGSEENVIVNQDPHPGTEVGPEERTITLFVNKNKETTAVVPELLGLYVPNAVQKLEDYGIAYTVKYIEKEGELQGLVYDQSVPAGETIKLSDTLIIYAQPDPSDPEMQPSETQETDTE